MVFSGVKFRQLLLSRTGTIFKMVRPMYIYLLCLQTKISLLLLQISISDDDTTWRVFLLSLLYKNYYTEHFWWAYPIQLRQNCTFSGKLCTIYKVLFLAMVSYFPLAKKDFSCVCIDPHPTPTHVSIILFVLVLTPENTMESHIPCLKSLIMYINFPRNSFLLKSSTFLHCLNASKYFALNLQKNVWKCKWTKIKIKTNKKYVK